MESLQRRMADINILHSKTAADVQSQIERMTHRSCSLQDELHTRIDARIAEGINGWIKQATTNALAAELDKGMLERQQLHIKSIVCAELQMLLPATLQATFTPLVEDYQRRMIKLEERFVSIG